MFSWHSIEPIDVSDNYIRKSININFIYKIDQMLFDDLKKIQKLKIFINLLHGGQEKFQG